MSKRVMVFVRCGVTLTIDQAMAAFGLANDTPMESLGNPADAVGEV
ncbi:MAG: hypothetical protein JSS38_15180 [Nitrospira sp.]|nr:hypothetical protein [Nitrospira sp.]MBS0155937.1 hypothetical protein [Nitrospira sp.]MBS0166812.1 hypothetical protein [Nitrospira sp.]MBX3326373.1 hypothetical protein [Nitrospira sp.]